MYRETLCITNNFLALLLNFQPLHIPVLEDVSSRLIPKQLLNVLYRLEEREFVSLTCISVMSLAFSYPRPISEVWYEISAPTFLPLLPNVLSTLSLW